MTDRRVIRVVISSGESRVTDAILQAVVVGLTSEEAWIARCLREGKGLQFAQACPRCWLPIDYLGQRDAINEITGQLPCQCDDVELVGSPMHAHGLAEAIIANLQNASLRRHAAYKGTPSDSKPRAPTRAD